MELGMYLINAWVHDNNATYVHNYCSIICKILATVVFTLSANTLIANWQGQRLNLVEWQLSSYQAVTSATQIMTWRLLSAFQPLPCFQWVLRFLPLPRFHLSSHCPAYQHFCHMIKLTSACPALLFPASASLATDILQNHPQPRCYLWQVKATTFSSFSGFWRLFGWADPPSTCCPASGQLQKQLKTVTTEKKTDQPYQNIFFLTRKEMHFRKRFWMAKGNKNNEKKEAGERVELLTVLDSTHIHPYTR